MGLSPAALLCLPGGRAGRGRGRAVRGCPAPLSLLIRLRPNAPDRQAQRARQAEAILRAAALPRSSSLPRHLSNRLSGTVGCMRPVRPSVVPRPPPGRYLGVFAPSPAPGRDEAGGSSRSGLPFVLQPPTAAIPVSLQPLPYQLLHGCNGVDGAIVCPSVASPTAARPPSRRLSDFGLVASFMGAREWMGRPVRPCLRTLVRSRAQWSKRELSPPPTIPSARPDPVSGESPVGESRGFCRSGRIGGAAGPGWHPLNPPVPWRRIVARPPGPPWRNWWSWDGLFLARGAAAPAIGAGMRDGAQVPVRPRVIPRRAPRPRRHRTAVTRAALQRKTRPAMVPFFERHSTDRGHDMAKMGG